MEWMFLGSPTAQRFWLSCSVEFTLCRGHQRWDKTAKKEECVTHQNVFILYIHDSWPAVLRCPTPWRFPLHCRSTPPSGWRDNEPVKYDGRSWPHLTLLTTYTFPKINVTLHLPPMIFNFNHDCVRIGVYVCSLPIFVCVKGQTSDLSPVFSQLPVTHHGHHVDDVDNRILRAHPDLVLIDSQHAVLYIKIDAGSRYRNVWAATEKNKQTNIDLLFTLKDNLTLCSWEEEQIVS